MYGLDVHHRIVKSLSERYFNGPIIASNERGDYVECMVGLALGDEWIGAPEWTSWDFTHVEHGLRLEVRQESALQSWSAKPCDSSGARNAFPVAPVNGIYDELTADWMPYRRPRRPADIFVFAWHPECDPQLADQRLPDQWMFFAVSERQLRRGQKSITVSQVQKRWKQAPYAELGPAVAKITERMTRRRIR